MPIRITGMNSGLDTESIVSALVMNYQTKVDKNKKAQTKLSWKADAWKSVNTQVNSLYTKVGNLRFSSAYATKKAVASDSTKAKVSASSSAVNGSQKLVIKDLAATGYLTGAQLKSGTKGSTKLKDLSGFSGSGKITVNTTNGSKDIEIKDSMTVDQVVTAFKDAGVNASFDEKNGRIFVSAKNSGKDNDFSLTAADEKGLSALSSLGLNAASTAGTAAYKELAGLAETDGWENPVYNSEDTLADVTGFLEDLRNAYATKRENEAISATQSRIIEYGKAADTVNKAESNENGEAVLAYLNNPDIAESEWDNKYVVRADGSDPVIYNSREEVKDEDGNVTGYKYKGKDAEGNDIETVISKEDDEEKARTVRSEIEDLAEKAGLITKTTGDDGKETVDKTGLNDLISANKTLKSLNKQIEDGTAAYNKARAEYDAASEEEKKNMEEPKMSEDLNNLVAAQTIVRNPPEGQTIADVVSNAESQKAAAEENIKNAESIIEENKRFDKGATMADYTDDQINDLAKEWESKIAMAYGITNGTIEMNYNEGAARVDGQDARIFLNNAEFTSETNAFNINGLSIEATGTTDDNGITVTTSADTDGLYDKIKDFLSEYNDVINSLMKQYNAESAKGYEPLTDDEKAEMTDTQIEKWEEKVKNSLLRRDQNLDSIIQSMATAMYSGFEINGKNYTLSSFGIHTMGLNSKQNENYAYHIDGDEDDSLTSTASDKLRQALSEDPDAVVEFMKKLSSKLYDNVGSKMKASSLRSAYTVYNDKEMATEYSDYTKTIKTWQTRLEEAESKYYKQFTAMEKALAQLNQNSTALGGLLGG